MTGIPSTSIYHHLPVVKGVSLNPSMNQPINGKRTSMCTILHFHGHGGTPVIIHFERWDSPLQTMPFKGYLHGHGTPQFCSQHLQILGAGCGLYPSTRHCTTQARALPQVFFLILGRVFCTLALQQPWSHHKTSNDFRHLKDPHGLLTRFASGSDTPQKKGIMSSQLPRKPMANLQTLLCPGQSPESPAPAVP